MSRSKSTKVVWDIVESIYLIETKNTHFKLRLRRLFTDRDMMERFGLSTICFFTISPAGSQKDNTDYGIWIRLNEGKYMNEMSILQMDPITNRMITLAPVEEYKAKFEKALIMRYIENKT